MLKCFQLSGKVAVLTGAAQGLGKAMAEALADAGADIVIADFNDKLAQKVADVIAAKGVRTAAFMMDVTNSAHVRNILQQVVEKFGSLDIMVNNAGISRHIPAENMTDDEWKKVMDINLNGVFYGCREAANIMIQRGGGKIINIASMSGIIVNYPQPQSSYNTSKAGVIMLTKSLAAEWAKYNIMINAIAPGYMETAMTSELLKTESAKANWIGATPMKRPGKPEELGGAVVYLASDASSFMTGHTMVIDGGYTIY
jgi:NAD(P)-dependent dehydrogenase (short-subunit alcohol dehydrogenase family)